MARLTDVHPHDPQPRVLARTVALLRSGGLIAYPTDSGYALGCQLGNIEALDRIRAIRHLDDTHHFTLVCADLAQVGHFVRLDTHVFRGLKAVLPGPYTFILPATREVPKRMAHPKKRTVGVRVPDSRLVQALLRELGEPVVSSTLLLPDQEVPPTEGWVVADELGDAVDLILDSGECGNEPTTVIDWSDREPEVLRVGAGDPALFA